MWHSRIPDIINKIIEFFVHFQCRVRSLSNLPASWNVSPPHFQTSGCQRTIWALQPANPVSTLEELVLIPPQPYSIVPPFLWQEPQVPCNPWSPITLHGQSIPHLQNPHLTPSCQLLPIRNNAKLSCVANRLNLSLYNQHARFLIQLAVAACICSLSSCDIFLADLKKSKHYCVYLQ